MTIIKSFSNSFCHSLTLGKIAEQGPQLGSEKIRRTGLPFFSKELRDKDSWFIPLRLNAGAFEFCCNCPVDTPSPVFFPRLKMNCSKWETFRESCLFCLYTIYSK